VLLLQLLLDHHQGLPLHLVSKSFQQGYHSFRNYWIIGW
jgi:hypothetical protein